MASPGTNASVIVVDFGIYPPPKVSISQPDFGLGLALIPPSGMVTRTFDVASPSQP